MDLTTKYAGLDLKNPIIVGSSNLTEKPEAIKKCEESGAAAVVLKSLFEEQIIFEVDSQRVNNMYSSYDLVEEYVSFYTKQNSIRNYLKLIENSKRAVKIPIIASINCVSSSEWTNFATEIEKAGADALELNMFIMPTDEDFTGKDIEKIYFDIIQKIISVIKIPITLKISSYFSGLANFIQKLSASDIKGIVLFNRFYSPDINLETEKIISSHIYSSPHENAQVLRWLGIMAHKVECDLAASTGVNNGFTIAKNLLAGAKATQIVSALYQNGIEYIQTMLNELEEFMQTKNYQTISDFQGKLSQKNIKKPMIYERAQFMKYFSDAGR